MKKLKYNLHKLLCKDLICENQTEILKYQKSEYAAEQKIIQLESDQASLRRLMKNMFYKGLSIVAIKESKNEEVLLGKDILDNSLSLYIFSKTYNERQLVRPLLHASITDVNVKTLKIHEIQAVDKSNGLGSIMLDYLINWAIENEIIMIEGDLPENDKENWEISVPFYEKYGFQVVFNEARTSGKISLNPRKISTHINSNVFL